MPTPEGWIADTFGAQPSTWRYFLADGEIDEVWERRRHGHRARASDHGGPRSSTFAPCVSGATPAATPSRPTGPLAEIEAVEARDPLLRNARRLLESGAADPEMLRDLVRETRHRVLAVAEEATRRPRLQTTEEVVAPLAPDHPERVARACRGPGRHARRASRVVRPDPARGGQRTRPAARWPAP